MLLLPLENQTKLIPTLHLIKVVTPEPCRKDIRPTNHSSRLYRVSSWTARNNVDLIGQCQGFSCRQGGCAMHSGKDAWDKGTRVVFSFFYALKERKTSQLLRNPVLFPKVIHNYTIIIIIIASQCIAKKDKVLPTFLMMSPFSSCSWTSLAPPYSIPLHYYGPRSYSICLNSYRLYKLGLFFSIEPW